jgi:hypothetical protein
VEIHPSQLLSLLLLGATSFCFAQAVPIPESPTTAVLQAFNTHDIVMLGEIHGNKQEYEWLDSLVANPEFASRVDDIVVEIGNSLYQKSVDRYIAGDAVPIKDVQRAWRNTLGLGPPSPVYANFYKTVRETNLRFRGKHQIRVLCGDPYIDWSKVKTKDDIGPFLGHRDQWYAEVVKDEVIAKGHRAFLIAGANHFMRGPGHPNIIESELRGDGAKTFVIVAGTNAVGGFDDLDQRFDSWPAPSIALLKGNWVGELPSIPVVMGGTVKVNPPVKLQDAADALLYLGPRDSLIRVTAPRAEVDGTPYEKELLRRMSLLGFYPFIPEAHSDNQESPQFERPQPHSVPGTSPAPPKTMDLPLPPRPPSQ